MQTMENFLCFLQSLTEPWLSLGSAILNMDPCGTFVGAVGLLLLYLGYLLLKSFLPTLWRSEALPQHPSLKRRKDKRTKGRRLHQRRAEEAEEGRRLLSVVKSPLGQYPDTSRIRQLLCPDPLCEVCNRTTAKVSRLLSRAFLEDAEDTTPHSTVASETELSSFLSSDTSEMLSGDAIPAPPPGPFPPSPSTLSPKQVTPLADLHSLSPLGDSLPPRSTPPVKCKFPVGYVLPPPRARFPPSPHHCQGAESVVQPKATLPLKSSSSGWLLPTEVSRERGREGLQDSGESKGLWNCKVPRKDPRMQHQVPDPETSEDHLELTFIQHFWGFPSPQSDSRDSITPVSSDSSSCVYCTAKSSASTVCESQPLPHAPPLSLSDIPPQTSPPTLPQSQIQHVPPDQPCGQIESPPPETLPRLPYEVGICGVRFHGPQTEAPSLSQSEVQNVEYNVLQKEQGVLWGLPYLVRKSREASQVHHVHTDSRRINLEQGQNPWVPAHVSCKGQDKTFLPAARQCASQHPN